MLSFLCLFLFAAATNAATVSAAGGTTKWEDIRCAVTLYDCSQNSNSSQEYIAGQCYATYSPTYGGAQWMLSADCSTVTVVSMGNSSAPVQTCSTSGGKSYNTIAPTTCIPGLAGNNQGGKIFATKKTTPAPAVANNNLCISVVSQYSGSTTCAAASWSSTIVSPYARGICISFSGATGSSMSSTDCLSYTLYATTNCTGTPTGPAAKWGQGCRVDGTTNSVSSMYGLPGSNNPPPPPPSKGGAFAIVPTVSALILGLAAYFF